MYSVFFIISSELITTNSLTLEPYVFDVFTTFYHTRQNDATNFLNYYLTKRNIILKHTVLHITKSSFEETIWL